MRSTTMNIRHILPVLMLLPVTLAGAPGLAAQAGHEDHAAHASPYTDLTDRAIKALSEDEVAGLRAGDGLGFALSAELNGLPGPKHVLEMLDGLALTPEQDQQVREIQDRMRTAAQELGERLVALEEELDRRFAHRHITQEEVRRLSVQIGEVRGELRAVHLNAHIETEAVLTAEQREGYWRMRYGG